MSFLNTAAQLLIDELQVAIRAARALVLDSLALRRLQEERGKALHVLALHLLRLLLRVHHPDRAALRAHDDIPLFNERREIGLRSLTMGAPIRIVHGEAIGRGGGVRESARPRPLAAVIDSSQAA